TGIRHLLKRKVHWQIVGEAQCPAQLMDMLEARACDVLISDYCMPSDTHADGSRMVESVRRLYPELKILVMTMLSNSALLSHIRNSGADAVLEKSSQPESILGVIEQLASGLPTPAQLIDRSAVRLTPSQMELIRMLAAGRSIADISNLTGQSVAMLKRQMEATMRRLHLGEDVDLARLGASLGLAHPLPDSSI
ncbi:hypothetical protein DBR33_16585, partial [Stenotrophomonas sp. HMWF022]